jgi:hypothetical protein
MLVALKIEATCEPASVIPENVLPRNPNTSGLVSEFPFGRIRPARLNTFAVFEEQTSKDSGFGGSGGGGGAQFAATNPVQANAGALGLPPGQAALVKICGNPGTDGTFSDILLP